jgi:chorismate dehydratase
MRPRLGHIQFLNCLPLYYGLVKQDVLLDVELLKGGPRDLARMLVAGELDLAPIPSIEYCRNWRDLVLVPDISVSSDGEVKSILLMSQTPAAELGGKTVALTDTSRTSQALTRILLHEHFKVEPEYVEMPPDLPHMMREADAGLLIGDDALRALYAPPSGPDGKLLLQYDLGAAWKDHTGMPMVYAVWAARRDFAQERPDELRRVSAALGESMRYSAEHLDDVATYAARWEVFPVDFLRDYFKTLRFEFGDRYRRGLSLYFQKAEEHGFVSEVAPLEFAG